MKRKKIILLLLSSILFLSGCNIEIRTIVPEEQGSIFDWFKKETPVPETEEEQENKEIETPKVEDKTTKKDEKKPEIQTPKDSTEDNEKKVGQPELDEKATNHDEVKAQLSVSITPKNPDKDGYVTLNVNGPANTPYTATFYFRTRESQIKGYCEIPFQVLLGGATIGYEVKVEVTALINGQVHKATTSFTPK